MIPRETNEVAGCKLKLHRSVEAVLINRTNLYNIINNIDLSMDDELYAPLVSKVTKR